MKLFVVGERTADPEQWSMWSAFAIVIAESAEQAIAVAGGHHRNVATEIPMDRPLLLCTMPEPQWGEDL